MTATTSPATDADDVTGGGGSIRIVALLGVVALAFVLNAACAIDFSMPDGDHFYYVFIELLKRGVLFASAALAMAAVTLTARRGNVRVGPAAIVGLHVDERPAPWIAASLFIAVGMLLLQSTIDLALFEPGPMALALAMMGALVGLAVDDPRPARRDSLTLISLIVGGIVALVLLVAIVVPVGIAESFARQADDLAPRQPKRAIDLYERAAAWTPVANYTYPGNAARAAATVGDPRAAALLDAIVAAAPGRPLAYLNRARFRAREASPDATSILADMAQAVARNPNDVDIRIEYADFLERFGNPHDAAAQLFAALAADDALDDAEPKRLQFRSPGVREQVQARAARLIGG